MEGTGNCASLRNTFTTRYGAVVGARRTCTSRARRLLRRPIALGLHGDIVPFLPGLDPPGVFGPRQREAARTEEDAQGRILRIDYLQNGRSRRLGIAGDILAAERLDGGVGSVIGRNSRGKLGRGAAPFGGEAARFDQRHFDSEDGNLGRERLAEALETPLRSMVQPDGRKG